MTLNEVLFSLGSEAAKEAEVWQMTNFEGTASTTPQVIQALTEGKRYCISDITISTDASMWIQIQDTDGNVVVPKKFFPTGGGIWSYQYKKARKGALGKGLQVDCSVSSGNVAIEADGFTTTV